MEIYANAAKTRFLKERLARFGDSDLVVVHLDSTQRNPAERIEVALTRLNAGLPVLLLSLIPITDYKAEAGYKDLVEGAGRGRILDGGDQYQKIVRTVDELLGQP